MSTYAYPHLIEFTQALLTKAGFTHEQAAFTADSLVEADLMGHSTHGMALLPHYLQDLDQGNMQTEGEPEVIRDLGAAITWDGRYLPGLWLTHKAIDLALERLAQQPVVTLTIQRSHHIGCLAVFPERATEKGYMMLLACSDPRNATVAPYGSTEGVYSPNPLAAGIPTEGAPIIMDISMSATANGLVNRHYQAGSTLPHPWLLGPDGQPTADPKDFRADPPSTILPLGGMDTGYKGFALGLLVEMLTSGLAGHGRADHPGQWGASVYLQLINPAAFGGLERFRRQAQHLVGACMNSRPIDPGRRVRIPGGRAFALRDQQKREGVALYPSIMPSLAPWADRLGVGLPNPQ